MTPSKDKQIPAAFLSDNASFKTMIDSSAIKTTFVLIRIEEVEAVVNAIPVN